MKASWIAILCAAAAIGLLTRGSLSLGATPPSRPTGEFGVLRRWRLLLSALSGVAAWVVLGGAFGAAVALGVVGLAFRTLSRARSPSALRRDARLRADHPLVVELLAHALAAGSDVESALKAVGEAVGEPWREVLAEPLQALRLGKPAEEVWAEVEANPLTAGLGRALARSHETGVAVSEAMRRLAGSVREQADLDAQAYARTIEVRAAVPLGVCFLPAFVLLGVVPLVASVLSGISVVGNG